MNIGSALKPGHEHLDEAAQAVNLLTPEALRLLPITPEGATTVITRFMDQVRLRRDDLIDIPEVMKNRLMRRVLRAGANVCLLADRSDLHPEICAFLESQSQLDLEQIKKWVALVPKLQMSKCPCCDKFSITHVDLASEMPTIMFMVAGNPFGAMFNGLFGDMDDIGPRPDFSARGFMEDLEAMAHGPREDRGRVPFFLRTPFRN